jgi:hypothetical protein
MKIDLRNVRTRWMNVDKDEEKAKLMVELLDRLGMTNHERFSAITGIEPHEGVRRGEEHYRSCAESHFAILEETILKDGEPVLILEDDVENTEAIHDFVSKEYESQLLCPDDADAIYLGTSHGDGRYHAEKVGDTSWLKIRGVFATHAILYLSKTYAENTIEIGKRWIYEKNTPFDVGLAKDLQPTKSVYAPIVPFFYQADSKNSVNKWEGITKTPLKFAAQFKIGTVSW